MQRFQKSICKGIAPNSDLNVEETIKIFENSIIECPGVIAMYPKGSAKILDK